MGKTLTFLGIESSCDDTAAAVVRMIGGAGEILSSQVEGQVALHADFGGVVPEIAARAHAERLDHCVERALAGAGVGLGDLDGIAVTAGPGLIGGVLSGVMLARGLARATGLPLIGINHLAGHALTPRLTDGLGFPYLILLVSGGHCQFLIVHGSERFERLGGTIDDAPGEAFDKVARLLGLGQPGGPAVEAEAVLGDAGRFRFPRPLLVRSVILGVEDGRVAGEGWVGGGAGWDQGAGSARYLCGVSGGGYGCAGREIAAGAGSLCAGGGGSTGLCSGGRGGGEWQHSQGVRGGLCGGRGQICRSTAAAVH